MLSVSFGAGNVGFNEQILPDVMYPEGKPVLHNFDEAKKFILARFIFEVSKKTLWGTILEWWAAICT